MVQWEKSNLASNRKWFFFSIDENYKTSLQKISGLVLSLDALRGCTSLKSVDCSVFGWAQIDELGSSSGTLEFLRLEASSIMPLAHVNPVNLPCVKTLNLKTSMCSRDLILVVETFPNVAELTLTHDGENSPHWVREAEVCTDTWFGRLSQLQALRNLRAEGFKSVGGSFLLAPGFPSLVEVTLVNCDHEAFTTLLPSIAAFRPNLRVVSIPEAEDGDDDE